jgi:hypothetical protein
VGAGTKDTGLSLTRLTFQITHATDTDTNAERDYILEELQAAKTISDVTLYNDGDHIGAEHVNRYITDGEVGVAKLSNADAE